MTPYGELLQEWQEWRRQRGHSVQASPTLTDDGLLLGAGTRLATLERENGSSPRIDIDGREEHILALLSVAYWRPVSPAVLGFLRRASHAYSRGEKALANIHLAHSRLPRLENAEQAACRLFMADRLLAEGLSPLDLLKGLDIDTTIFRLLKASPDDPKHPGWPAGTSGGLGGRFRPKDGAANTLDLPVPIPAADFSGGFHDAVVDAWMKFFQEKEIPAVKALAIRIIGPNNMVVGFPDIIIRDPDGGWIVFEIKTGDDPVFTPNQMAYLPALQIGGHVYSTDPRIRQLGLEPGAPFPPMDVIAVHAPGPGQPYDYHELPPPVVEP